MLRLTIKPILISVNCDGTSLDEVKLAFTVPAEGSHVA